MQLRTLENSAQQSSYISGEQHQRFFNLLSLGLILSQNSAPSIKQRHFAEEDLPEIPRNPRLKIISLGRLRRNA